MQFEELIDSCDIASDGELLLLYSRSRGRLGTVQLSALGEHGLHSIEECEESLQLHQNETVKDSKKLDATTGEMAILTSQRLLIVSKTLAVVSEIQSNDRWELCGANSGFLLLSDEHWLYYLQTASNSQLVRIASLDRRIERPLGMAIDRLVVARLGFDPSDSSAKLEIQQRHAVCPELLFGGALRATGSIDSKLLESVAGLFWDANYSGGFIDRVLDKCGDDPLALDFARKYGGIDRILEKAPAENSAPVQDILKQSLKEYLLGGDFGPQEIFSLGSRQQTAIFGEQTRDALKGKVERLNRRKLFEEELATERLSETLGRLDGAKRGKLLRKTEVCFGQELYLYQTDNQG